MGKAVVASLLCLFYICMSSLITGTVAVCDCDETVSATNAKIEELTRRLSQQNEAIAGIKRTIKSCRRTVFSRLGQHDEMIALLQRNADFSRLTSSNINQLHLHVAAKDVKLDGLASSSCKRQNVDEGANQEQGTSGIELVAKSTEAETTPKPAHELTLTTPAASNYGPVVGLPGGEVLVTDRRSGSADKVLKLHRNGRVAPATFTSRNNNTIIKGMVVHGDDLYIVQSHGILSRVKVSTINLTEQEWSIPDVGNVYPGFLVDEELYLVDFDQDQAFSFNLRNNQKTIKKTGLDRPGALTSTKHGNGRVFIISEYTGHRVSIFNDAWNKTKQIGGRYGSGHDQLYHPWQVTVTPWSTILVADTYNNRLSEFSLSGGFIKHRLSDRLYQPLYISYSSPYLWLVQRRRGGGPRTVKRYQILR